MKNAIKICSSNIILSKKVPLVKKLLHIKIARRRRNIFSFFGFLFILIQFPKENNINIFFIHKSLLYDTVVSLCVYSEFINTLKWNKQNHFLSEIFCFFFLSSSDINSIFSFYAKWRHAIFLSSLELLFNLMLLNSSLMCMMFREMYFWGWNNFLF